MTDNQRQSILSILKAEQKRLNEMVKEKRQSGEPLCSPAILKQSQVVVELINDLEEDGDTQK